MFSGSPNLVHFFMNSSSALPYLLGVVSLGYGLSSNFGSRPIYPLMTLWTCLARLLLRGSSRGAGAVLEEPVFYWKNGSSKKTFDRAPLEEPEPEPERSPAKQVLTQLNICKTEKLL